MFLCSSLYLYPPLSPQPPIVPKVSHEGDTSNFDVYPEEDWKKDPPVPPKDLEIFQNFWWHCRAYLLMNYLERHIIKLLSQVLLYHGDNTYLSEQRRHILSVMANPANDRENWPFIVFIYLNEVDSFAMILFLLSCSYAKRHISFKTKRLLLSTFKKAYNQVFFYSVTFLLFCCQCWCHHI